MSYRPALPVASSRRASIEATLPCSASDTPLRRSALITRETRGLEPGNRIDRGFHDRHHLVPLAFDIGEHRVGFAGQSGLPNDANGLGGTAAPTESLPESSRELPMESADLPGGRSPGPDSPGDEVPRGVTLKARSMPPTISP